MKNNFRISAFVAILIIVTTISASGQFARVNSRMSYPGQCLNIPGLTDAQIEKITAINTAHQTTIDNMRSEFRSSADLIKANEIKANMTLEQNNHLKEITKVLDADQLKYFNENIVSGPAGRGRSVSNSPGRGRGFGYANGGGRGRGPCGMGYGYGNRARF